MHTKQIHTGTNNTLRLSRALDSIRKYMKKIVVNNGIANQTNCNLFKKKKLNQNKREIKL